VGCGAMGAGLLLGLLVLAAPVQAAGGPTVAVVEGDLLGAGGPEAEQLSRERRDAILQALATAGINYQEVTDTTVEHAGLPDVPVAILPYSRAISDDELYHLRAFLNRPARLIIFFTTREELAADLGVRLGPVIKEIAPGQFYRLDFMPGAVAGLPAGIAQDAPMIRELEATGKGRVLGRWRTLSGQPSSEPGVVLSDKGAFVSSPPQKGHKQETARLLRALVGHFAPELWEALAPTDPHKIGPAGRYKSLAEMAAALRAAKRVPPGAVADVDEALALLKSVPDLLARGDQDAALEAPRRAQRLAERAWWRSYPSPTPELRGVWAWDRVDGGWEQAMRSLAAANFNAAFPYVASGAAAYYPSSVLPECRDGVEGDPVAEMVRWGKEYGVQVHPRVLGFFTMGAPDEVRATLKKQGRLARSPKGTDRNWLCPSNHENRLRIIQTVLELATKYPVDGVQFDYLRYAWKDECVCPTCREHFQADTGIHVDSWPSQVLTGSLRQEFLDWRREQVTSLLRTVRQKLKEKAPNCKLSAAVFINWESHRDTFGQDWKAWIDEGLVDFVCPMTYTGDLDKFRGWVEKQERWAGDKVPVAMGIGPLANPAHPIDPQGVLDEIQIARQLGCEGFVLFNYQEKLARDYLPLLALGATSAPAQIPTQAKREGDD